MAAPAGKSAVVKPICRTIKVARGSKRKVEKRKRAAAMADGSGSCAGSANAIREHAALMSENLRFGSVIW